MKVYLDNAATTPLDERVLEAMLPYMTESFGNPSSIHTFGRETKAAVEKARKTIAKGLNASVGEIFFTSGGTESANLVIKCSVESLGVTRMITSKVEHHCVLHPLEHLAKKGTIKLDYVDLDDNGNAILSSLESLLKSSEEKTLVALMAANNEIGNLLNLTVVGNLCKENGALFLSDSVQAVCHQRLDLQEIPVDFITGSAHKFHGPKGVGFVYIKNDHKLCPLLEGGSQERNMRAGTENVYGIVGMAKAFELCHEDLEKEATHIQGLKTYFYEELKKAIPEVEVNGNFETDSLLTVLNVALPKHDNAEFLIYNLDINQVAASAGSACTSGSNQGSHVLNELPGSADKSSVRFSFSRMNTKEEIDYTIEVVKKAFVPA